MATQYTPEAGRHMRGVIQDRFGFPGEVVFKVFTCKGWLVHEGRCPDYRARATEEVLWSLLDAPDCCPADHGIICPDADARLRAVVERNAGQLSLIRSPR